MLSVFETLLSKDLEAVEKSTASKIELVNRASGDDLPFWRKREILTNAIYGVDIDPLAVEVAKLNLLLRLLEGCSREELEAYLLVSGNKLLPDLSSNIKCGNSLVDYSFFDFDESAATNIQTLRSIRPFDWGTEFPFEGFDAIVGNPPYIRVQNLAKYIPNEYRYYKSSYCNSLLSKTAALDKYQLFVERGLSQLKPNGKLGMIIPNKFMANKDGKKLRSLLTSKYHVLQIIDFGAIPIFQNRSTYTCILIATPNPVASFSRIKVSSLSNYIDNPADHGRSYPESYLTSDAWAFPPEALSAHLDRIKPQCDPLSSIASIFVGLQTSCDSAYIFSPIKACKDYFEFIDMHGNIASVETELCKPCILDVQLEAYGTPNPNRFIIFPYQIVNGKAKLILIDEIRRRYPRAYSYLVSVKTELDKRSMSPARKGNDWHKFGRTQSLTRFDGNEHLIWPVLSTEPKYAIDTSGEIMFTGGGNGPYYGLELNAGIPESIEYIQAVMNYWMMEAIIQSRTSIFRGEYYSHGKQFVAELPVRRINFMNKEEASIHDKVVILIKKLNELIKRKGKAETPQDRTLLLRSIEASKRSLTILLDVLYQSDDELKKKVKNDE